MFRYKTQCRACGFGRTILPSGIKGRESTDRLIPVFDLGIQPMPNDFRYEHEELAGYAPLSVNWCPNCTLAQLSAEVDPHILYDRYPYETSRSKTMRNHFDTLVTDFSHSTADGKLAKGSVVEIGSNDGYFLKHLKDAGAGHVLGIDPAKNLSRIANESGVPTLPLMFGLTAAASARQALGNDADLVIARHCFCHISDWVEFIEALKILGGENTLYYIEVPHAKKLLECGEFDTIYFEHTSYLTIRSIQALLSRVGGLSIVDIKPYDIHGGCIGITIGSGHVMVDVDKWIAEERCGLQEWVSFSTRCHDRIDRLGMLVRKLVADGKRVAAYGASAKCTVWCNACGFTKKEIAFVADTTKAKWNTTVPGTNIPVWDDGALIRELPDYAVLFAWNFADEILFTKKEHYTDKGGRFIIPTPEIEIRP